MLNGYLAKAQLLRPNDTLPGDARLFILCNRRPDARLRECAAFVTRGSVAGTWHFDLSLAGQVIIEVAPELPVQPGTSVLRSTAPKTSQAEQFQCVEEILTEPTLSDTLKQTSLLEEHMLNSNRTDATVVKGARREEPSLLDQVERWRVKEQKKLTREAALERRAAVAVATERALAQGVAQGAALIAKHTLDTLLAAAAAHLPADAIEALRKQGDPVAIALAPVSARKKPRGSKAAGLDGC